MAYTHEYGSARGAHAEIIVQNHVIYKTYEYPKLRIPITTLIQDMLRYRKEISFVFTIPNLYEVLIHSPWSFTTVEEHIKGKDARAIVTSTINERFKIYEMMIHMLYNSRLSKTIPITNTVMSTFPTSIMISAKPQDIIVQDNGIITYIDFMPPRFRNPISGLSYVPDPAVSDRSDSIQSFAMGDVVGHMLTYTSWELKTAGALGIDMSRYLPEEVDIFTQSANQIDPTGNLIKQCIALYETPISKTLLPQSVMKPFFELLHFAD